MCHWPLNYLSRLSVMTEDFTESTFQLFIISNIADSLSAAAGVVCNNILLHASHHHCKTCMLYVSIFHLERNVIPLQERCVTRGAGILYVYGFFQMFGFEWNVMKANITYWIILSDNNNNQGNNLYTNTFTLVPRSLSST